MADEELDLGHGHLLRFLTWEPDDLPQNRETYDVPPGEPMPRVDPCGAIIRHRARRPPRWCEGVVHFDVPGLPETIGPNHRWTVKSWDPLTLDPSLKCNACGDHGHVVAGRWVPA